MTALSYSNGKTKIINSVMCYPDGYSGALASADVHVSPDGKYVYGSNRIQHNSIGIFKIDPVNGKVSKIANQDAKGEIPRNFLIRPEIYYWSPIKTRAKSSSLKWISPPVCLPIPATDSVSINRYVLNGLKDS